ncbi:hypothetical protein [Bosea sp. Leaf344]|uniref:hypothetical protein n=1 Tax=Bosea sp. Leaf344 TaxID=1736346 RepID=UPI000AA563EF|nr:hypothetical protein [Bosea sp. Leaf344]
MGARMTLQRKAAVKAFAMLGLAMGFTVGSETAFAQASGCEEIQKLLTQRQSIVAKLNASQKSKRKLTPQEACSTLGTLVSNGNAAVKFANANMDWCQIPQSFVDGLKADNEKAAGVRNQACNAVKQQAAMQKRAQQQAQGANPFGGGDAITGGGIRIPQGAL